MQASCRRLQADIHQGAQIYGVSRGFGPLAEFDASSDGNQQGLGLIHHLANGHGPALAPQATADMLALRLLGMRRGFSAISIEDWNCLASYQRAGFIPVVPSKGSVSASGDLIPLAHAALALSGRGGAWKLGSDGSWGEVPARDRLAELALQPHQWQARSALAFVNGTSASLAVALGNARRIKQLAWSIASLTGVIVGLLGCSSEPYEPGVVAARGGLKGHAIASAWIRSGVGVHTPGLQGRRLQEPYSLRCAPQIIGSVLDHLEATDCLLLQEAVGCSDNPVVMSNGILHAGNFHAINAGLTSDGHVLLAHQLGFLAERQLALLLEPRLNGELPALLADRPGATSGLAGVQLAASAATAEIRQRSGPATVTALPTNLYNQDIVPMSLVGALRTTEAIDLVERILGSLGVAVAQVAQRLRAALHDRGRPAWWTDLIIECPLLREDRPLHVEVDRASALLRAVARREVG